MSLPLIWAPSAKKEFAALLEYVEDHYGLEAALKILDQTDTVLNSISIFPEMFPVSALKQLRKAKITKQTSLIYQVTATGINLLHLWDNRMNPDKLDDLLK